MCFPDPVVLLLLNQAEMPASLSARIDGGLCPKIKQSRQHDSAYGADSPVVLLSSAILLELPSDCNARTSVLSTIYHIF